MAKLFKCEVLTPYRKFFSGNAESVTVTGEAGRFEILANHETVLASLKTCLLELKKPDGNATAYLSEGFVTVHADHVEIFADSAEWPSEIDTERAKAARDRAKVRLETETLSWAVKRSKEALLRAQTRLAAVGSSAAASAATAAAATAAAVTAEPTTKKTS